MDEKDKTTREFYSNLFYTQIPSTFFTEDERMRTILRKGDKLSAFTGYVYIRLLCESVKSCGRINGSITRPLSEKRLAMVLDLNYEDAGIIADLTNAIFILSEFELIKWDEHSIIIIDFDQYIGRKSIRAEQARQERAKKARGEDIEKPVVRVEIEKDGEINPTPGERYEIKIPRYAPPALKEN